MPTCRGKLLMEGEGEVKGDKAENTQKRAHVSHNMHVLNRPAARVSRSGFSSLFYAQNIPNRNCCPVLPSFCAGSFPFPGRTLLLLPPGYEKAVQTQPVSSGLPLGAVSDLYPLGFFFLFLSSSPHSASSLFIYSWMPVLLLIILQRI